MSLEAQTKEKIYSRVCELVARKHFDPGMNGANWEELSKARRDQILQSPNDGRIREADTRSPGRTEDQPHWFSPFQEREIPGRHAIAALS